MHLTSTGMLESAGRVLQGTYWLLLVAGTTVMHAADCCASVAAVQGAAG